MNLFPVFLGGVESGVCVCVGGGEDSGDIIISMLALHTVVSQTCAFIELIRKSLHCFG